jgi:hypothetical protein
MPAHESLNSNARAIRWIHANRLFRRSEVLGRAIDYKVRRSVKGERNVRALQRFEQARGAFFRVRRTYMDSRAGAVRSRSEARARNAVCVNGFDSSRVLWHESC